MALWGKKDATGDKPKFVTLNPDGTLAQDKSGKKLVLIDNAEAANADNKKKGITGPGWYLIQKSGDRVKAELLISLADAPVSESGDAVGSDTVETDLGVGGD